MSGQEYPPFVLGRPRFDQSNFQGRLRHFLDVVDPRSLLTSEEKLKSSVKLLEDYKNDSINPGVSDKQLWDAQKIKQAIIHPDTGLKIFMPFRMSGFVPFGTITIVGLLLPNQTLPQVIFWQWLNQSHNACVNYANRNASKLYCTASFRGMVTLHRMIPELAKCYSIAETPMSRFVQGYAGAISAALGIAVSLNILLQKAEHFSPAKKMIVQRFIPFPATSTASSLNAFLMRRHEMKEGIDVLDDEGTVVGVSQIAAKRAVMDTVISRMVLPAPILVIPPIIMATLERTNFLKLRPRLHLPIQVLVCTLVFGGALPVSIALFPQVSEIAVDSLEPEFKTLTDRKSLFYNKGL